MQQKNIIPQWLCVFSISAALLLSGCSTNQPTTSGIAQSTGKTTLNEKFRSDYTKALNQLIGSHYAQANTELSRIMADNPGFAEGWANLALAQLKTGNIAEAKKSATKALQLEQKSAPLQNLLGLINVEDGAYKTAEQHYARALELAPNFANAHYNLALLSDIYYQNTAKAIQYYERYLALLNNADPDTEAWVAELKRKLN
jgi:Tfp pilus assembly protein PilF